MAYVGKTPAATALTSNDLANGIVSADKLATNAVTTVKVNADAITNAKTEFTPGLVIKGDGLQVLMEKLTLNCSVKTHMVFLYKDLHIQQDKVILLHLPTISWTNGYVLATDGSGQINYLLHMQLEAKPTVADVSQTIAPSYNATDINITGTRILVVIPNSRIY